VLHGYALDVPGVLLSASGNVKRGHLPRGKITPDMAIPLNSRFFYSDATPQKLN
jgi:hypothetical protein